jgi:hypothetical protein
MSQLEVPMTRLNAILIVNGYRSCKERGTDRLGVLEEPIRARMLEATVRDWPPSP